LGDPLEELKKISAAEKAESQSELDEKARDAAKEREKEKRKAESLAEAGKKAPGFFSTVRFFGLAMVGLIGGTIVGSAWLEGDEWWKSPIVAGIFAAWGAIVFVFWLDSATWKGLLPFKVEGMETIHGRDKSGDSRAPYIAFDIHIRFVGVGDNQARNKVLEILAERINRVLKKDGDMNLNEKRVWRVADGGHLRGEGSRALYTQRLIEAWLRREVRLLHRAFPVGAVTVIATYTGDSFRVSSSD
jgi:hypothetical protein